MPREADHGTRKITYGSGAMCLALAAAGVVLALAAEVQGVRPLVVDDVDPVESDRLEVAGGPEWTAGARQRIFAGPSTFTLGVARWLEVGVGASALSVENRRQAPRRATGPGDVSVLGKARLPGRPLGLDLAIAPSLLVPVGDDARGLGSGSVAGSLVLIATRRFSSDTALHVNFGLTAGAKERHKEFASSLFMGVAGETPLAGLAGGRLRAVAEIFGTTPVVAGGRSDVQGRAGFRYQVTRDLILDTAVGRSLTAHPEVRLYVTAGVTWTFDLPWKARLSYSVP